MIRYCVTKLMSGVALVLCALGLAHGPALAASDLQPYKYAMSARDSESSLSNKLESRHIGEIQPATYHAGEDLVFTLSRWNGKYLLRFEKDPEIYVLYPASTTMGGRLLKYDTGATAISVSGWGGLTIYTKTHPSGLPVMRADTAEPPLPIPMQAKLEDVTRVARDQSARLAYIGSVKVEFVADWARLGRSPDALAAAFDAIINTGRGIEQYAATSKGQSEIQRNLQVVRLQDGMRPAIALSGKTLLVTFDASKSYAGRPSSRAIRHALSHMLTRKN